MSKSVVYSRKTIDVQKVHSNVDLEVIQITEDKLRLILNEHLSFISTQRAWISPLSILLTLIVVFVTTDFKDAYFSAATWEAIFLVSTFLTTAWLIATIIKLFRAKSIEDIVCMIKNTEE
mgnify:CR=1 FL=1